VKKVVFILCFGILGATLSLFLGVSFADAQLVAPSSPSPADGATAEQPVTLQWSRADFPEGVSGGYIVELQGQNIARQPRWAPENSYVIPQNLLVGAPYQWRVTTCFGSGISSFSDCGPWSNNGNDWKFTATLAKPTLDSPLNTTRKAAFIGSDPQCLGSIKLQWKKVVGADRYNVVLNRTSGTTFSKTFEDIKRLYPTVFKEEGSSISFCIPQDGAWIKPLSFYNWRVIPFQASKPGIQSDTWEFFAATSPTTPPTTPPTIKFDDFFITSILPSTGSLAGGTEVTISGKGFKTGTTVLFGGSFGTMIKVSADGISITVKTPSRDAPGIVTVRVTDPQATDGRSVTGNFQYTEAPLPPGLQAPPLEPGLQARPLEPGLQARPLEPGLQARPLEPGLQAPPLEPGLQAPPLEPGAAPPPGIFGVVDRAANVAFTALIIAAIIFVLVAAFQFLTGGGNPEAISGARDKLIWAAVGIAIALVSKGVAVILQTSLGLPSTEAKPGGSCPGPAPSGGIQNPLNTICFSGLLDSILNVIFTLSLIVVPFVVIYAGFLFVTGGGNPQQISRARDTLIWAAVGFGVILISKGLPFILKDILGI